MLSCEIQDEMTVTHFMALVQKVFHWNITKIKQGAKEREGLVVIFGGVRIFYACPFFQCSCRGSNAERVVRHYLA